MPPTLASQSADAEAAARQAEFNEKKWVWVPDEREGYLAGWVLREEGEEGEVQMAFNSEIRRVPLYALSKMNPPKFDRVDDIADLTFLNEASVVHNLRLRYGSGAIYTYSGLFLVAVNPYQHLPLYSDAIVAQYRGKRRDENPPHIFAIAERAWVSMGEERENQSILITGESGAGKTESTKKVIQYLAAIATDAHLPSTPINHGSNLALGPPAAFESVMPSTGLPRTESFKKGAQHRKSTSLSASVSGSQILSSSKSRLGLLERQILQANPILEAFGNAQTQRNNNSSRFGKFIRISFAPDGSIAGANIDWYLLEKSRVVVRNEAERSFHVFYQLMEAGGALKDDLLLDGHVENYEYLNKSRREVDGIDDVEEWKMLKQALDTVGLSEDEQFDLFRVVAAVLHIGNIEITATRAGDALMPDPSQAERVCHLLGVPVAEFTKAVLRPRVLAGREWVQNARTKRQALDELSSLSKTLYEKSFGLLVERINRALDRPSSKSTFIGVLDIAGFEIFDINGYEQLLINYTNEKLQQFFNHHMFVLEQEEYTREGIDWDYVNFGQDLQPTIELIEATGATIGVLSCLDEECIMPGATDLTFTNKLHQLWSAELPPGEEPHPGHYKYEPARFDQGFLVQHYAGKVEYRTDGWLEKNKDPLNDNLTRVMAASTERYIATCFAEYADGALSTGPSVSALASGVFSGGGRRMVKKGAFRTVGQRHREQLSHLMTQLMATQPHFVRCIVPNGLKKPARIDAPLVLDQLRCNGVLEGIRIARLGYPNRLPFVEFRQRYEVLTPGILPRGYMDGRKACLRMVDALELDSAIFKIGTSKIFFKAGVLAELEERRDSLLFDIFARFQAMARRRTARRQIKKILNRAIAIRTIQRNARQYNQLREWPWWQLYTKVRPLLAATRNDEELQKKELELALIRERAERDKQEREALENLKMQLEAEKQKVEDSLLAERALNVDKDGILARAKQHESELEQIIIELEKENADMKEDIETMDSQLVRALKLQKENEEKHESLKEAFSQAAEHLVQLEAEQSEWVARETELNEQYNELQTEADALRATRFEQQKTIEELKNLILQKEEDLERAKDRMESAIADLERKAAAESTNRELLKGKSDSMELELRQAKDQLAEMTRTANDYSSLISQREKDLDRMTLELEKSKEEKERLARKIIQLQGEIDTLSGELEAQKDDRERNVLAREKLQAELDELRTTLRVKDSEDTRKNEAVKSMEAELVDLRDQSRKLQSELNEARKQSLEANNKLKVELDSALREHATLQRSYESLLSRERDAASKLAKTESALSEAEKARRPLESELQVIRSRQVDMEGELAEVQRAKEVLEKQLISSQTRQADFEDAVLQLEREKTSLERQAESVRKDLEAEMSKRAQLEKTASGHKAELALFKDRNTKLDRDLNKALSDIKNLEWQNKQLVSKQDKTIVEHVHVLEEAKRVTDKQLKDAKMELEKQVTYIRSLEKAKTRLTGEAEDLTRETERERREISKRERELRIQQERASRALTDFEREKREREAAELHNRKLQTDLQSSRVFADELQEQLEHVRRSKANLEAELAALADDTQTSASTAKLQRQYEARITQLENELHDAHLASTTAARIKTRIDKQHAEIRRLIMNDGPKDDTFRSRLLRELQAADEELAHELSSRSRTNSTVSDTRILGNMSPSRRTDAEPNGGRRRTTSHPDPPPTSDRQANALRQQLQVLEIQMATSDRVRQHLEASLRDMTADMDSSDGSKQFLERTRLRLSKENARLAQLLEEEAETRRVAETAQKDGVQMLWQKFQNTMAHEQESYTRLEESRKALLIQQRATQADLEEHRRQLQDMTQIKKQLQAELSETQERLDAEIALRNEEASLKRQLQLRVQELEVSVMASDNMHGDLAEAVESFKEKTSALQGRLEEAEIARAKATRAETLARRSLSEAEKAQADAMRQRNSLEKQLSDAQEIIHELETRLYEEGRETSQMEELRARLAEEMEDERKQHQQDIEERDFNIESMRKKYQGELAQLSEELQAQRDSMSRLREENRTLRSDYDELQLRHDDEVYSGGAWKKEKERLETKVNDLNQAYETSMAAQSEQQNQIVALHSQVRELRGVLNDVEADRVLLQKARRALQAELESIKLDHTDASKLSSTTEIQKLQMRKQDLERSLEEKEERVALANERLRKAESYANECQMELGRVRVENSELDKMNANLEKQIKELNLRIVDLETRASLHSSPRPSVTSRRMESRIEELTNQLNQSSRDKTENLRMQHTADKNFTEMSRKAVRMEEELRAYESKVAQMRQTMDELQNSENDLQLARRRAEREAADYKQKALSLEREVERLRGRLDRPSSAAPTGSPRKFPS